MTDADLLEPPRLEPFYKEQTVPTELLLEWIAYADALKAHEQRILSQRGTEPVAGDVEWLHTFINCTPFGADAPAKHIQRAHRIVDSLVAPQPAVPEGKVLVPVEPTEAEIDAPRAFLLGLELGINKTAAMRKHLDRLGTDYSFLPDWFKNEDTHLTKAGKAICIRAFMLSAAPKPDKPAEGVQEGLLRKEVLRLSEGLRWYADGKHILFATRADLEWDEVEGWLCAPDGRGEMVEPGHVAQSILEGGTLQDDNDDLLVTEKNLSLTAYHDILRGLESLVVLDPAPDSTEGKLLLGVSDALEAFERVRFDLSKPTDSGGGA